MEDQKKYPEMETSGNVESRKEEPGTRKTILKGKDLRNTHLERINLNKDNSGNAKS